MPEESMPDSVAVDAKSIGKLLCDWSNQVATGAYEARDMTPSGCHG